MRENYTSYKNFKPDIFCVNALNGDISNQISTISFTRLVKSGPGLINFPDESDKKKWSGINNHVLLVSRYSSCLACELEKRGLPINPQIVLDADIDSHAGRRQHDEVAKYPHAVSNLVGVKEANYRKSVSSEKLAIKLIKDNSNIKKPVIDYLEELWSETINKFDALVTMYIDLRISDRLLPLYIRTGDIMNINFVLPENKTSVMQAKIYKFMKNIINNQHITLDEADEMADKYGLLSFSPRWNRKTIIELTLKSADTERKIKDSGINLKYLNSKNITAPNWEKEFRKKHLAI
jgi:hypothetical protein